MEDYQYKEYEWYMNKYGVDNVKVIDELLNVYEKFSDKVIINVYVDKKKVDGHYTFDLDSISCYLHYRPCDEIVFYNIENNKTLDTNCSITDFFLLKNEQVSEMMEKNEKSIEMLKKIKSMNEDFINVLKNFEYDFENID